MYFTDRNVRSYAPAHITYVLGYAECNVQMYTEDTVIKTEKPLGPFNGSDQEGAGCEKAGLKGFEPLADRLRADRST